MNNIFIQIVYNKEDKDLDDVELVEIGPRFLMNPIKIFDGCMSGSTLFLNNKFKSPNAVLLLNELSLDNDIIYLEKKRN